MTALACVLAAVYVAGAAARSVQPGTRAGAAWLALLGLLWAALLVLSPDALWVAFPLYFLQLHLLPIRWSLPAVVATAAAGYVGPGLVGLGAAALLARGYAVGVLWALLVLLALLLLQIRNFFGLWAVLVAGSGLFAVTWWADARVQLLVAYVVTWFLLLAAPRPVVELQEQRRRGHGRSSDADVLARLTRVPGLLWVGLFLVVTVGCLVLGGSMLLGRTA